MGWIYERDGHRLAEDELTTGEWEHLYILVNRLGIAHREIDISPLHCPVCRSAIAIQAALKAGIPSVEAAAALLVDLPRGALPNAFSYPLPDLPDPTSPDVATGLPQAVDALDGDGVAAVV